MRHVLNKIKSMIVMASLTPLLSACGEEAPTFSILPEQDVFYQNSTNLSNKLDILFLVDNSGSMADEQANLASNFSAFINDFSTKGYDYKIAVATTDSWYALFGSQYANYARFRTGSGGADSGVRIITPDTLDIVPTFQTNVNVGTNGGGDERAFQSFKAALESGLNTDFRRTDAYLAIIIVSDEDDFSWNGTGSLNRNYNDSRLHSVASYVTYLDQYTQSSGALRKYSVSAITIKDQACLNNNSWGVIGQRYMQLADATDGVVGDICSASFADDLEAIQTRIAELSTQFFLSRRPVVSTITVVVNGNSVPKNSTNGWSYNSEANSIVFHGSYIPQQGAQIIIDFDPIEIL